VLARLESGAKLDGIRKVSYLRVPDQPQPLLVEPGVANLAELIRRGGGLDAASRLLGRGDPTSEAWVGDLVSAGLLVSDLK
jgi:hypothetical protein